MTWHGRELVKPWVVDSLEVIGERSRGISNFLLGEPSPRWNQSSTRVERETRIASHRIGSGRVGASRRNKTVAASPRQQQCKRSISVFGATRLSRRRAEGAQVYMPYPPLRYTQIDDSTDRSTREFNAASNRFLPCYRPLRVIKFPVVFTGE